MERMKKYEDRKYFNFPHLYLVKRVEKWGMKIFFIWLRRNMRGLKINFV